ncbi:MAG: transcription negative regulator ChrR [Alteromonadaceae bacterium]|uniref:Transcription negative regulator ChrR n=2 Tax=Hydrocarboniclastica marina TaxID=2259620 RepID=A0A4V1D9A5_9ALTE|nr:transcription negative regulator ChrR [Alteromonadaceae bacterium]QCF28010.1 transcription negative regulator ChrR [Hydrocarboniclastica marina]
MKNRASHLSLTPDAIADIPESEWQDFRPGVSLYPLHGEPPGRQSSALLRYQPGASVPGHTHLGVEHIFVIQGSQEDENGYYPTGTLLISPIGSSHHVTSVEGCIVLAVWSDGIQVE